MTTEIIDEPQLLLEPLPDLEPLIEALIFVSREAITIEKIVETLQAADINAQNRDVRLALKSLEAKWSDNARPLGQGLVLKNLAGGWVFATAPQHAMVVKKIIAEKPLQLSKAQVEVLSVVAYRQPLTRVDIDEIRGVDSSFALKKLMQLKLLKILGKSEGLGRPLLYGTTKDFLEFFSLNSLNDLPTLKQYEALVAGEEVTEIDFTSENLSLKDLFAEAKKVPMFSSDVERLSEEALKSLDEALLRADNIEKTPPVKE
jgi:segregation and condensation protein B